MLPLERKAVLPLLPVAPRETVLLAVCWICLCAVVLVRKQAQGRYVDWTQEHREVRMGGGDSKAESV